MSGRLLSINALTDRQRGPRSRMARNPLPWVSRVPMWAEPQYLRPSPPPSLTTWEDPRVGWSLLLPLEKKRKPAQLAEPHGEPEAIRVLWEQRGRPPIYRYDHTDDGDWYLLRFQKGQSVEELRRPFARIGIGSNEIPFYLLIVGPPSRIPWALQYRLNGSRAVGRLDLDDDGLSRYVQQLLGPWNNSRAHLDHVVIWATDHAEDDITRLMKNAIARKLEKKYASDNELKVSASYGEQATIGGLKKLLAANEPGMVVTTSHGCMRVSAGKELFGVPVDQQEQLLEPEELLRNWQPNGAIWYAHACCSAGGNKRNIFRKLVPRGSDIDRALNEAARAFGTTTAPLPRALLGAAKPLRAFIGHVQPTFDVTLMNFETEAHSTDRLVHSLYENLFQPLPLGLALREFYEPLDDLLLEIQHNTENFSGLDRVNSEKLVESKLIACDLQSTVILGDPTVALPLWAPAQTG